MDITPVNFSQKQPIANIYDTDLPPTPAVILITNVRVSRHKETP